MNQFLEEGNNMPKALKQLVKKITTGNPFSAGASTVKKKKPSGRGKPSGKMKKPPVRRRGVQCLTNGKT